MVSQQLATAVPQVSAKEWAFYGRVFDEQSKPLAKYTVFLVDSQKTYQEAYGFAYTDETGYFLLSDSETQAGTHARAASHDALALFVEVANTKGQPIYLSTTVLQAKAGNRDVSTDRRTFWKPTYWRSTRSHPQCGYAWPEGAEQSEAKEDILTTNQQVLNAKPPPSAHCSGSLTLALSLFITGPHDLKNSSHSSADATPFAFSIRSPNHRCSITFNNTKHRWKEISGRLEVSPRPLASRRTDVQRGAVRVKSF